MVSRGRRVVLLICYVIHVTCLDINDSLESGGERIERSRGQRESKDSREPRDNREIRQKKEPREPRVQRNDYRDEIPGDETDTKERKDSIEGPESKEFKESRDPKDLRDPSRELKETREPRHKKDVTTPDVDEFLEKILKSDKIKQIAELIAQKAADKILSESKAGNVEVRSSNKEKPKENDSYEKDKNADEFDDDEVLKKGKLPKIDAKAAMKKVSKFPDDDVSLSYKHFSFDNADTKDDNNKHHSKGVDELRDDPDESRDKYGKIDSRSDSKFRDSGGNDDHKHFEKRPFHSESDSRSGKRERVMMMQRAVSDDESVEAVEPVSPKQGVAQNSKKDVESRTSTTKLAVSADISDSESNKVPVADVHSPEMPSKAMIRREGEKLYAFAPSPDYDEYHEKLSSMLKSVRDKTMRSMKVQSSDKEI